MVKTLLRRIVCSGSFLLLLAAGTAAQDINPTPWWVNWKGTITINGQPAPIGTIVNAYDPSGTNCGRDTVSTPGLFGYTPVYRDDPGTILDEGATVGQAISFRVLGLPATIDSGQTIYTADGDTATSHLSLSATIGLEITEFPSTGVGQPRDTVRFQVRVHNTGSIRDFYGIIVDQTKIPAWEIIYPDHEIYNGPDSQVYVWFDVVVPDFPGTPPINTLSYIVYSKLDPTVTDGGDVELNAEVLDVDDPDDLLPGAFTLYQNYPNPFNPSTTISFDLPRASSVRVEVYNALGQIADEFELGSLSAGANTVEYDASELSSGIYFYRVVTEYGAESRKMVLVK